MDATAQAADPCGAARSLTIPVPGVRPPRVAVIVGCYNQSAYVEAALRSVAAQSYDAFECVVLDDASTDGSLARIEQALQSLGDRRFRAIPRRANGGQMAAMLEGLDATTGPFVAFLDADDLWHPEFLQRHVLAHMSARGSAAISCSNLAIIDEAATQLSGGKPNFMDSDPRRASDLILTEEVLDEETRVFIAPGTRFNWIWSATSGMMFRRSVLDISRPARPELLRICADYYFATTAHMLGGTVRIERSLGCYRLHGENGFSRNPLFGSRATLGRPSREIMAAAREELIRCLCDNAKRLMATLPPNHVADVLVAIARSREAAEALAQTEPGAQLILSALPPKPPPKRVKPLKRLKRQVKAWLRGAPTKASR